MSFPSKFQCSSWDSNIPGAFFLWFSVTASKAMGFQPINGFSRSASAACCITTHKRQTSKPGSDLSCRHHTFPRVVWSKPGKQYDTHLTTHKEPITIQTILMVSFHFFTQILAFAQKKNLWSVGSYSAGALCWTQFRKKGVVSWCLLSFLCCLLLLKQLFDWCLVSLNWHRWLPKPRANHLETPIKDMAKARRLWFRFAAI